MNDHEKRINEKFQALIDAILELRAYVITSIEETPIEKPTHQKKEEKVVYDFEAIYKLYPRKMGKSIGKKRFLKDIKTDIDYEALKKAIIRSAKFYKDTNTGYDYIPYFSTFMGFWRDWIELETGQVKLPGNQAETTAQYMDRVQRQKAEEEWETTDPAKVRQLLDSVLKKKPH